MNLDLILENLRLQHIEKLLTEATSDLEVVRGQRLINESIIQLRSVLMEEGALVAPQSGNLTRNLVVGGAGLGALAGGIAGHEVGEDAVDPANMIQSVGHSLATNPADTTQALGQMALHPVDTANAVEVLRDTTPVVSGTEGAAIGGLVGLGAGLGARRLIRR